MSYIPIDVLLEKMGSAYKMVILAAKRTSALGMGAAPLVDVKGKPSAVALEEILQDKLRWELKDPKEDA